MRLPPVFQPTGCRRECHSMAGGKSVPGSAADLPSFRPKISLWRTLSFFRTVVLTILPACPAWIRPCRHYTAIHIPACKQPIDHPRIAPVGPAAWTDYPAAAKASIMDYEFDLGSVHRPITTNSPAAQRWFDRGLAWTYGFNHEEAVSCFRRSAEADPDCAMAQWGIAYAIGPQLQQAVGRVRRGGRRQVAGGSLRCCRGGKPAFGKVQQAGAGPHRCIADEVPATGSGRRHASME